jgi:hypothetical protein
MLKFSLQLMLRMFLIPINMYRDTSGFNKNWNFHTTFTKSSPYPNKQNVRRIRDCYKTATQRNDLHIRRSSLARIKESNKEMPIVSQFGAIFMHSSESKI